MAAVITLRPATTDDLAAVCALINRAQQADGVPQVRALEELVEDLQADEVDLRTDMRVAVDQLDEIRGFVHTVYLPSDVLWERCYLFGDVDPRWRGQGIGRQLLSWAMERGRAQLDGSPRELPRFLRAQCGEQATTTRRLLQRLGFQPVRYHEELLRPLTDLPEPAEIRGVRIVAWPDDRDEEIRAAKNAAFADHWGSTPTSATGWESAVRGFGARPDLSFIAVDSVTDQVVGHCLCKRFPEDDGLLGRRDAWIDSLGTLREVRGRGLGSAMIAHALRAFAAAPDELTHASIGVDSENPTGAAKLYRRMGFEPQRGDYTYEFVG